MKKLKKRIASTFTAAVIGTSSLMAGVSVAPMSASAAGSNYAEALGLSLYFYDANECGNDVNDNALTWRGNCHTYDSTASLSSATGLSGDAKAVVDAANGGKGTADVSGGYHDAGDHVKFNVTMAFNGASLGWAYYAYPEAFKETGSEAHLFEIMKNTSDYLMKTTYLDASGNVAAICHTVSDESDHNVTWEAPEVQTYNRPTYWFSGSTTNNYVCDMMAASLASTAAAIKQSDAKYAAECLKYADAIYNYSRKYTGTEGSGMGNMYNSGSMSASSAKAWAEAWLYLADSSKYSKPTAKPTSNGCYNGNDYDGWIYSWGKVWGGYACLMANVTGDSSYLNEVKYNSDRYSNNNEQKYYIIDGWGNSRYNCAWQTYALTYGKLANQSNYLNAAKYQMDFILGNNPSGYSYLIGYGDKYPTRVHHR
nr:glycoside hydrolase family 9 protein [Ruminococcus sp.]